MLYIVASYHCMQFQGKLMNQTCENSKKPSFRHNFGPFWLKFGLRELLLWLLPLLDIINCCKLSFYPILWKTNQPNLRKWQKKTSFESNFGPSFPPPKKILISQALDIGFSYHHVQYHKKINDLILRKLSDGRQ